MNRPLLGAIAACAFAFAGQVAAQDVLIRNATVHTAGAQGTLHNADVLVRNGRISAVGSGLAAGNAQVVEANGRALTPALFGGIADIGLEEVSLEDATTDGTQTLGADSKEMTVRPEFDVTLAYNPESVLVPIARVEGIGFTLLSAGSAQGGSIVGGQGGVVRLDGSIDPIGPPGGSIVFLVAGKILIQDFAIATNRHTLANTIHLGRRGAEAIGGGVRFDHQVPSQPERLELASHRFELTFEPVEAGRILLGRGGRGHYNEGGGNHH